MALGICDVKDCEGKALLGWRPNSVTQDKGKQICEHHWRRHKDKADDFDLCDAFEFARPWAWSKLGEKPPRAKTPLQRFVRDVCCNWDDHYTGCLQRTGEGKPCNDPLDEEMSKCECLVFNKERCSYFEYAVLHKPDYPYKHKCFVDNPEFERQVRSEYAEISPEGHASEKCEKLCKACGVPIDTRKMFCLRCARIRKREQNKVSARARRKAG